MIRHFSDNLNSTFLFALQKVITHTSNQVKHDITLYWNPKPGDEGKTKQIL